MICHIKIYFRLAYPILGNCCTIEKGPLVLGELNDLLKKIL